MPTQIFDLNAPRGFSLKATVLSHGWHECLPFHWSEASRCFQTVERIDGEVFRVSVVQPPTKRRTPTLSVTIDGPSTRNGTVETISARVRVMLGLDRDMTEFYDLCGTLPALRPIPSIGGGRITRSPGMTENILKMLCSTNVNWTQAVKMINRIAQLGPHYPHHRNLTAWPTPREILNAGEKYLDGVCRLGYRCDSILRFLRDVDSGKLDPDQFDTMAADPSVKSDDILALLLKIRGVGPATAHGLLGFLGRHDRLAIDSATIAHVARTHTGGTKPTRKQIEAVYAPYGKWKNLVYWCESWLHWATAEELVREVKSKK
jgi:3-methyladenine DNA glycosylase/8-oxoguanine DNA glycosylase